MKTIRVLTISIISILFANMTLADDDRYRSTRYVYKSDFNNIMDDLEQENDLLRKQVASLEKRIDRYENGFNLSYQKFKKRFAPNLVKLENEYKNIDIFELYEEQRKEDLAKLRRNLTTKYQRELAQVEQNFNDRLNILEKMVEVSSRNEQYACTLKTKFDKTFTKRANTLNGAKTAAMNACLNSQSEFWCTKATQSCNKLN